jgi:hypothetical protein
MGSEERVRRGGRIGRREDRPYDGDATGRGVLHGVDGRAGRRYLELVPRERDAAVLRARLGAFSDPADVLAHTAAFEQAVRHDFERGDILALDGWILSRTELRAAALFALTSPTAQPATR